MCLSPVAPHLCEELWEQIGKTTLISEERFPTWDSNLIKEESFILVIQVNGKVREQIEAPINISKEEAIELASKLPKVQKYLEGKTIKKCGFCSGKTY